MSAEKQRPAIHVVAAALIDSTGRVLIAQRPAGKHLAGGWEFPGGKIHLGESPLAALRRELSEELGVEMGVGPHRPLCRVRHAYPDRDVFIDVRLVREFMGVPRGLEGQAIRWCPREELQATPLLPADEPVIKTLLLPERIVECETDLYSIGSRKVTKLFGCLCEDHIQASIADDAGADFVVVRSALSSCNLSALCKCTGLPVFAYGTDAPAAWALGASGVHQLEFIGQACRQRSA